MSDHQRIAPEVAQAMMEAATPGPWRWSNGLLYGLRSTDDWVLGVGRRQEEVPSAADATLIAAAPDLAHTVIAQDAEIAALRADLAAARVGMVTAEAHARAVREAYSEGRHDAPEDYWRASPRQRDQKRMWADSDTRAESVATLRASGLDDARAVALADGEVCDG